MTTLLHLIRRLLGLDPLAGLNLRDPAPDNLRALSLEELVAAMSTLITEATTDDTASLTEEQADRYEAMEAELNLRRRSENLLTRGRALLGAVPGQALHVAETKPDETLNRAFESFLRTGKANADLEGELNARAQETGTPSEGGYLIPEGFRDKIVERLKRFGGIESHVENISTSTGATLPWPTVDDTANSGEVVAEEATIANGADVVLGQADLGAYSFMSGGAGNLPVRVSWELLQDSAVNIEALLARLLAKRIGRSMAAMRWNGTGVAQPKGIVNGVTPVQPAANTGWTRADLLTFIHSVDPDYRDGAKWAFNDATLALLENLEDDNGRPLFLAGATGSIADKPSGSFLMGYPVVIDQSAPTLVIADSTVHAAVFGDLEAAYVWRTVKDFTLIVDPMARKANRQTEYICWARADGVIQDPHAYSVLSGKS